MFNKVYFAFIIDSNLKLEFKIFNSKIDFLSLNLLFNSLLFEYINLPSPYHLKKKIGR